jgi:predicted negative regulator of RcsB-dependent stress response
MEDKALEKENRFINFLENNKKKILFLAIMLVAIIIVFFMYSKIQEKKNLQISQEFNKAKILLTKKNLDESKNLLIKIINKKNKFYSPLSLNIIIENNLVKNSNDIKNYYNTVIDIRSLEKENINLIKYKQGLYLIKIGDDQLALDLLEQIVNSDSFWKNSSLRILRAYYVNKGEKNKVTQYDNLLKTINK